MCPHLYVLSLGEQLLHLLTMCSSMLHKHKTIISQAWYVRTCVRLCVSAYVILPKVPKSLPVGPGHLLHWLLLADSHQPWHVASILRL